MSNVIKGFFDKFKGKKNLSILFYKGLTEVGGCSDEEAIKYMKKYGYDSSVVPYKKWSAEWGVIFFATLRNL